MRQEFLNTTRIGVWLVAITSFALITSEVRATAPDLDGDGIPNIVDPDVDNDGIPNALDKNVDGGIAKSGPFAGQFIGDHFDNNSPAEKDIDGDSLADDSLGESDIDGDGLSDDDELETDIDGDGRRNDDPAEHDTDGDGRRDDDDDEDDVDGDGEDDRDDDDDDNDGEPDEDDSDHDPDEDEVEVEADLAATPAATPGGRARVTVQQLATGKIEFRVRCRYSTAGNYDIVIDGVTRGILTMEDDGDGETDGRTEFETNPNKPDELPLDFEVIGKTASLVRYGVVYYTGTVPTPPDGPGDDEPEDPREGVPVDGNLTPAAFLTPEANANIEVDFGLLGAIGAEIEVEDIPAGDYDVLVGGVNRATLTVALDNSELRGKVEFDAEANDPGELPLDFAVAGESISISQGGVEFFSGSAPDALPAN